MHLLTGATGYIGGRLLRRFERNGSAVRCLCRNPEALRGRIAPGTEVVQGDLARSGFSGSAFSGVDTAFYLVHSMNSGEDFEAEEQTAASHFAEAREKRGRAANRISGRSRPGARTLSSHAQPGANRRYPASERRVR